MYESSFFWGVLSTHKFRFVTQIQSVTALEEMHSTKFECQLAPVGDPNMKVEWFFNGKPLSFSKWILYITKSQKNIKKYILNTFLYFYKIYN